MLLKKKGFPEEDILVLVNVTKVNPNSVFVTLDHYEGRTGLIHISEISPGRIRNIRDYVVEGKKIVCKILRVDKEKGHIDVSLRRVTEIQKRNFLNDLKQEQKAEKLLQFFAEQNKLPAADLTNMFSKIGVEYNFVFDFFRDVVDNVVKVEDTINLPIAKKLEEFIREKIQPEEAIVKGKLKVSFFNSDGVSEIKSLFKEVLDDQTVVRYLGAGAYSFEVKDKEFKDAEKLLKQKLNKVESFVEKRKGVFSFERIEA
ncbi:S1 RNA-binding domain-containing protein [Candidatus Woesearchaeota archaeon]|jgi:translation initiation factor 2 subunit 1|nr:S1 RNA-binding domain-containing protein [Candidatus Woesearchaeota archaeon]MBT4368738.1 S1 RNA-binding domain-containing protein [Candidatus Woesearchaeota archaeon]MBT4712027.1 S1 RNA-binding domain-containing protein [Candidatus Woesearchaeota archaeon]MBT6638922.1 S1 RNA-binding domain-containing protein [Candidatus Woesearchaeota archaeon]MBT7134566.1 S1 RNA-binding domain-containing protein [Candidatus Woesearchaeota archaeon]